MNFVNWDRCPVFKKCIRGLLLKLRPTSKEMLNVSPTTPGHPGNRINTTGGTRPTGTVEDVNVKTQSLAEFKNKLRRAWTLLMTHFLWLLFFGSIFQILKTQTK